MKKKRIYTLMALIAILAVFTVVNVLADDGPLFHRNVSRTPETETGGAQITMFPLYVLAQNTSREILGVDTDPNIYLTNPECSYGDPASCAEFVEIPEVRPLFSSYNDGLEHDEGLDFVLENLQGGEIINTGTGFGDRDAWGALSLDDGATWRNYNLSESADRSSFNLKNGDAYPGDVFRINHVVAGNRIAVAWISRFCESGSPLYSWDDDDDAVADAEDGLLLAYPELDLPNQVTIYHPTVGTYDANKYTGDLFGVAGSQGSVDYTLQGFPEVGEIPYGCVWVARGTLEPVACSDDPETGESTCVYDPASDIFDIVWRQAERLTSGRRDANRVDITATPGAGFIISWQEDPEGLRPGKGLGPGEGWSGAIANAKTDIWYTYIDWDHFDDVCLDAPEDPDTYCLNGELPEFALDTKPKIAVPFSVPMRLTDTNLCKANPNNSTDPKDDSNPYCYADFDANGTADLCATNVQWLNPGGTTLDVCVAEDLRVMNGRTASTRIRWVIKPYTKEDGTTSAWVAMAEEKMKALGTELDPITEEPIDIGKNMWYHTFEFNDPELVQQGLMLNSPALDPDPTSATYLQPFPVQVDEWGYEYYETEIARRFNIMVQGIGSAMASETKTSAILIYKEGILNQGGPADIFIRRVVLPDTFDPAVDNPFAYENVVCDPFDEDDDSDWLYADGLNPNYVRGLCMVQGMNVSGTTIVSCNDGSSGDTCAASFPWDPAADDTAYPKVLEWVQENPEESADGWGNLNDPSWMNPYDVSKGHRGFIDGDFVMMMYATAPNWKANTTGNEAYNLYIRRSFDGGQTWTTLPENFAHIDGITYSGDGTTTTEWYGGYNVEEYFVETFYPAGEFEQARNISQLTGTRITTLDPRYTPSGGMLKTDYTSLICFDESTGEWASCEYADDPYVGLETRDPSVYFVTYETGDNTVVDIDTAAVPLDMYYSRATNFGDDYDEINICLDEGYPNAQEKEKCGEFNDEIYRWDWLENGAELATEASVTSTPNGDRFYAVWNSELEIAYDVYTDMDMLFRRLFYIVLEVADPEVDIISVSKPTLLVDQDLLVLANAWDNDPYGSNPSIVEHEWTHTFDGVTTIINDGDGDPLTLNMVAGSLDLGSHTFSFRVKDNEGTWSAAVNVEIQVIVPYQIFLPIGVVAP